MSTVETTTPPTSHWKQRIRHFLFEFNRYPSIVGEDVVVNNVVDAILSTLILSVIAALFVWAGPTLMNAPENIGRFLASACKPGQACPFGDIYFGFGLAVFLIIGITAFFVRVIVRSADGWFMLQKSDFEDDENIPDIVLDDIEEASLNKVPRLTALDIARRTGLDRTLVQQCLDCLIEDGDVVRVQGNSDKAPHSKYVYLLADA